MEYVESMENIAEESPSIELAWKLFAADKKKTFVAVTISPFARVTLGERFGFARGEDGIGKISAVLRALGADAVVDPSPARDVVTLLQVKKMRAGEQVLSLGVGEENSAPNADEVGARLVKKYYRAQNAGKTVRVIAVVGCEPAKEEVKGADVALSVDELADILESTVVNLRLIKKEAWDMPLGVASGGAYICSILGGESEAVARCLLKDKSRFQLCRLIYSGLYGGGDCRIAEVFDGEKTWKFAVTHDLNCAKSLKGREDIHFVEYKGACGCKGDEAENQDEKMTEKLRALGLRLLDKKRTAVSADVCPSATQWLRTWEMMTLSGEAFAENELIVEEIYDEESFQEDTAAYVEELVQEILAEETVEEIEETVEEVAEEVAEEIAKEEIEETVEEEVVEKTTEEMIEEREEMADEVEEKGKRASHSRRLSTRERRKIRNKKRNKRNKS